MHYQTRKCNSIVRHRGPAKNVYTHIQNLTAKMYTLQQILTIDIFENGSSYDRKVAYGVFSKDKKHIILISTGDLYTSQTK